MKMESHSPVILFIQVVFPLTDEFVKYKKEILIAYDTDFTELISSPKKAFQSGLDSVDSSSTANVFLQQVKFSCELELMNDLAF